MSSNAPRRAGFALVAVLVLAVVGLAVSLAVGREDAASTGLNGTSGTLRNDQILDVAMKFAATNGESAPTEITAIAASHQSAVELAMPGSEIDDDGVAVDLIVIRGHFTRSMGKGP